MRQGGQRYRWVWIFAFSADFLRPDGFVLGAAAIASPLAPAQGERRLLQVLLQVLLLLLLLLLLHDLCAVGIERTIAV